MAIPNILFFKPIDIRRSIAIEIDAQLREGHINPLHQLIVDLGLSVISSVN